MVKVFAPVNIAWVKYMGKNRGLPSNASFSMTLDSLGTETSITIRDPEAPLSIRFEETGYVPPLRGREKAERFLLEKTEFLDVLAEEGFSPRAPRGLFSIATSNNIPAGTGIATSASGFAALTLAWFGILAGDRLKEFQKRYASDSGFRSRIAKVAAKGSGSACRSFHGPFVEWTETGEVLESGDTPLEYVDFVLLLEEQVKAVSSSEAHERVKTSPRFAGRAGRAGERLAHIKRALREGHPAPLPALVLEEALDMHELFHTSTPPFSYLNPESKEWIGKIRSRDPGLPSANAIATLDAGANVHLFVLAAEAGAWERYFKIRHPALRVLCSKAGKGARFVDF
jgi:diphosphomevalonate decarboxylase